MKIIKYLLCWLKARFCVLPFADFCALCDSFEKTKNAKIAKNALQTYFASHTPTNEELDRIYRGNFELRWLYLENISRKRRQTDYEQHQLVCNMPFGGPYRFPSALRAPALDELFAQGTPQKLGYYVCDYALPADYELRLVELCRKEKETGTKRVDSYRRALLYYLQNAQGNKMMIPPAQLAVLALDDEELTIALVKNCTMYRNILFLPTLRILIEQGSLNVLRKLLFSSFVESDELAHKMLERFPQLRRIYDISCLRRPLYKLECEVDRFWGTVAPSMDEHKFILNVIETNAETVNREDFIEKHLLERLANPNTTPYFCAWCADCFPEVSERAYQRLRQIAKHYRDCYKK